MTLEELGKESRKLMNEDSIVAEFCCAAPKAYIDPEKNAILFIGLNPAGDKEDAERDKNTSGFFLNYYNELELEQKGQTKEKKWKKDLTNTQYFKPILEFFTDALSDSFIAWEWCNCDFSELLTIIKRCYSVSVDDEECLKKCYDMYKNSKYQIIVRDLVYYHQTSSFKDSLKPHDNPEVKKTVKELLDDYISMFSPDELKLIYISSATSCKFVEAALEVDENKMKEFGGVCYKGIPIIFAGRPLNGVGIIDKYSKIRLLYSVKSILTKTA